MQIVVNPIDVTLKFDTDDWSRPVIYAIDEKDKTLATFCIAIDSQRKQLQMRDERTSLIISLEVEEIIGNDFQIVLEKLLNEIGLSHISKHEIN